MTKQYGTPGPRAIYPEMCSSPSLARCGLLANLLFPRLVSQADDQGRLPGGATAILLTCLPRLTDRVSADQVDEALAELTEARMLMRYADHGDPLLQIVGWWSWQQSQRRAYPSRWAPPKGWYDLVYGVDADPPLTFREAVDTSSQRNAAIRSVTQRIAARATGAHAGPRARRCARAMPCRASASAVPPPAPGAPASSGARGGNPKKFSDLVPRPGGER